MTKLFKGLHDWFFNQVHGNRLIYNACWEDPRLDRQLLNLDEKSKLVMITSAGCNALDYLLDNPAEIHCVDMNFRQNAVLELKLALIKRGRFDDLFSFFGEGWHSNAESVYDDIRLDLSKQTKRFWDSNLHYFKKNTFRKSFYFQGASGDVAWISSAILLRMKPTLRKLAFKLIEARTLEEQKEIYSKAEPLLWDSVTTWLMRQPTTMTLLGVPRPQIALIDRQYPGGLSAYVKDKVRHVLTEVPIQDNYFWKVYLTGSYTRDCCPGYLEQENYAELGERADRVKLHTTTLAGFLEAYPDEYSHYILLDHQDWLAQHAPKALQEEWDLILANAASGTKVMLRSAGLNIDFIPDNVKMRVRFRPDLTGPLHPMDRVGTYGSFHLAEVL